ncbi:MAG: AlpA family phage regulatory protein [Candidatus Thiodiazotropha sp.]
MAVKSGLPETGFLRLPQIVGDKESDPPIQPIIPVSPASWWNGVRAGRYPKPVKLGPRTTAWRVEDIKKLIDSLSHGDNDEAA